MILSPLIIEKHVRRALEEDLGPGLDLTSAYTVPDNRAVALTLTAREEGVLAGLHTALCAFALLDPGMEAEIYQAEGTVLKPGDKIATITGHAQSLLMAERVALNFLIHMSGIATLTAQYVAAIEDLETDICDTRKTLPGLRCFQKYAVHVGGGINHRFGLYDAVLIKDNHIAMAGGVKTALQNARLLAGHMVKIEIEVDDLAQLDEVLAHGGADVVLLDNMTLDDLRRAVELCQGQIITEASGGVALKTVRAIAQTGVNYISVGALTHSATALDIGLDYGV